MLSVSDIRTRIINHILTLDGWKSSRHYPDLYPMDTKDIAHKSFAVITANTTWVAVDRQRRTEGCLVDTEVEIRFAFVISEGSMSDSYNNALDTEHSLLQHLAGMDTTDLHFTYRSSSRTTITDGKYFIGSLTFTAQHLLKLM